MKKYKYLFMILLSLLVFSCNLNSNTRQELDNIQQKLIENHKNLFKLNTKIIINGISKKYNPLLISFQDELKTSSIDKVLVKYKAEIEGFFNKTADKLKEVLEEMNAKKIIPTKNILKIYWESTAYIKLLSIVESFKNLIEDSLNKDKEMKKSTKDELMNYTNKFYNNYINKVSKITLNDNGVVFD